MSMSILKDDELPATFVSRPNPRARERGGASNVRIGPRSGLCISAHTTVGGCRACISTFGQITHERLNHRVCRHEHGGPYNDDRMRAMLVGIGPYSCRGNHDRVLKPRGSGSAGLHARGSRKMQQKTRGSRRAGNLPP